MEASLFRSRLYRKNRFQCQASGISTAAPTDETESTAKGTKEHEGRFWHKSVITLALSITVLGLTFAQVAKRRPVSKGPRALGLVEVAANGKAHLVPVTIMIDGRFYDAGAYKADPVPMALQSDIVYEAVKTGVSQGIFTVVGAFHGKDGWAAAGKWRTQAEIEAEKAKSKAEAEKRNQKAPMDQDIGGPPKLKRAPESSSSTAAGQSGTQAPSQKSSGSAPSSTSAGSTSNSDESRPKLTKRSDDQQSAQTSSSIEDPNRPTLRHQAASATAHEQTKAGNENEPLKGPLEFIPAISDADGPEPRPYAYQLKPDEQEGLMKKMQAMAADEVRARASHLAGDSAAAKPSTGAKRAKAASTPMPEFHDLQLRVFDLSNSNEAVLILTAQAKIPSAPDFDFMVALVAREDIYGDLHKVFAQTTDDKHLDALPRYDLIDAVDADGDGVGELLFRESWDSGTAFALYRVIGDQLWPLFEGKPGT
jgi:hypothetical protein